MNKNIYLLIGQKGSGKSFIGVIFEKEFGIKFIHVEDWAKVIKNDRDVANESYLQEVFEVIEQGIRQSLRQYDKIVFESIALTEYFDRMLLSLKRDFDVTTIGIKADSSICLDRVRTRDQTIHINISDNQVKMINEKVKERDLQTDFKIYNETKTQNELKIEIGKIINLTQNKLH